MPGIVSYGAYIPFNRIKRSVIGEALGIPPGKGERAVASYDEDTVTMAVEAARYALNGLEAGQISSVYFASTDPPYQEKLNAATIHAALNLNPAVRALDLGGSVRAGLTTLLVANDAALAGGLSLAALSDVRLGLPEAAAEQSGGDGAVAFVLGKDNVLAEIECCYSETLEHLATWRVPGEKFAKNWEERFSLTQIYTPLLDRGIKGLLDKAGIDGSDLAAIVVDAPNPRAVTAAAKSIGQGPERFVDGLAATVGHTGTAHAGLMIAAALDDAKPGDRIAVISVSDGVDAFILRATDAIASYTPAKTVKALVESKRNDISYTRFLKWRGILNAAPPRRPDPARPAGPPSFRDGHWKFAFVGSECTACGARQLPPQSVCVSCGAAGQMKDMSFADRTAKVNTYTLDYLAFTPQPPMVATVIDFDGGGRLEIEVTDCEPEKVDIGDEVEMTFRRFYTADGVHNYFWKARPVR